LKAITLVQSTQEAIENITLFNSLLQDEKGRSHLVRLLPHVQSWYAVKTAEGYRFGPSKFIGYAGMSAELYASETGAGGRLDGRVTEKKLSPWAVPVSEEDARFAQLNTALARFCAAYGTFPNSRSRISIFEPSKKEGVTEMEQVRALCVLIGALSEKGKRELKRLAFA